MTYAERIKGELMEGIGVTDTLKQVVISGDGNINRFYDVASKYDGRFDSEYTDSTKWSRD